MNRKVRFDADLEPMELEQEKDEQEPVVSSAPMRPPLQRHTQPGFVRGFNRWFFVLALLEILIAEEFLNITLQLGWWGK